MATNTKDGLLGFVEEVTARVGGPSFLDPRQLLYASPIVFLASVIFRQGLPSAGDFNIEIITQGLSICLTYLFAMCLSRLTKTQREKKPFNFVQIILAGATIGSVKFYSVELSIRLMLPEQLVPGRVGALLVTVLIFSLLLIPGLSYAESKRIDFEKDRAEMVQRKTGASLARARVNKIDPQIEQFLSSIRSMRLTPKPEFHQKLALEIRDFVENEVRPLSRQLWKIEDQKISRFSFWDLLLETLKNQPFTPLPTALAFAPIPFLVSLTTASFADTLVKIIFNMAAIFLVLSIGQVIGRRFGFLPIVFGVSILLSALSVVFLNLALFSPIIPISDLRPLILMIFWIGSLAVFLALTRTALKNASSIAEELADLNDQQDKEYIQGSSASLSNRDLANFLHSTVQNQLLSAAMSIESEGSHLEFSDESIKALERALMSQGAGDHGPEHSYKESLESVVERWRPLLEIETRVSLETNRYPGVIFAQVLEEGISNAVRHGEASRLAITLSKDGDLMKLQIEDDGFGPKNGTLGLGTALFEDATNGNWQLEALDRGGSLLTLNLAL